MHPELPTLAELTWLCSLGCAGTRVAVTCCCRCLSSALRLPSSIPAPTCLPSRSPQGAGRPGPAPSHPPAAHHPHTAPAGGSGEPEGRVSHPLAAPGGLYSGWGQGQGQEQGARRGLRLGNQRQRQITWGAGDASGMCSGRVGGSGKGSSRMMVCRILHPLKTTEASPRQATWPHHARQSAKPPASALEAVPSTKGAKCQGTAASTHTYPSLSRLGWIWLRPYIERQRSSPDVLQRPAISIHRRLIDGVQHLP